MKLFYLARRVLQQILHDKRFLIFSIVVPLIIAYFLKLFFDTLPPNVSREAFVIPFTAYIVYFLAFIMSALLLVQERTQGTLDRMLINGLKRSDIIIGYVVGYLGLALIQAGAVLAEVLWLFNLSYDWQAILAMGSTLFILSIVSVLLGIFISTFARKEAQVIPFIPLVVVLPAFLSGLLADPALLPRWAELLGKVFPISYGINSMQAAIKSPIDPTDLLTQLGYLGLFAVGLTIIGTLTFRERQ
jgi:ABC-2 type transport system permease protein